MIIHRDGWRYSGRVPAFFTGQAGCYCCAAAVSFAYHVAFGSKAGGVLMTTINKWTSSWAAKTAASRALQARGVATAGTNYAYFFCGIYFSGSFLHDTDSYESTGDSWTSLTAPPAPVRENSAGCAVTDCYSFGGTDTGSTPVNDNDAYSISGNSWTSKANVPSPTRRSMVAFSDATTYAYAATGADNASVTYQDVDRYDPSGDSWSAMTNAPSPARTDSGAFVLSGKAYVTGGQFTMLQDNDEYDMAGNSWASMASIPSPGRHWHGAASVAASSAGWITGGETTGSTRMLDHDEYVVDTWTNRTDLPSEARLKCSSASC